MQQSFFSVHGKIIIENDVLYIRNIKPVLSFRRFSWFAYRAIILIRFASYLFEYESPKRNTGLVLFGFLSVFHVVELAILAYKAIFQQSFATRIPLRNVASCRWEDDDDGFETRFYLQLYSGKERQIRFRTREKEYEPLADVLSQYLATLKHA